MDDKKKMEMIELPSANAHFVLVHGISSGGWSWFKIRALLEKAGYKVSAPDLKSAGVDPTDPKSILTPDDYDEPLIQLLAAVPESEKIILVGTSGGGLSVTNMIHKFPKKIHTAIFVGATMLRNGFLTEQDTKDGLPDMSQYDIDVEEGVDQPQASAVLKKDSLVENALYLTPLEDQVLVASLQKPGPLTAMQNAKFTGEGQEIDEVKRVYIKTTKDRTMKPEQQDAMIKKWPPVDVFTIDSDHGPFVSAPLELFHLLLKAATI